MKKFFLALGIGIAAIIPVRAQDKPINLLTSDNVYLIKPKALRDFYKTFKTVTNEDWYIIDNGFMAKFKTQDIQYRVIYNSRGNWVATFRYYNEDQLRSEVRNLIKSIWYDGTITLVTEVNYRGKTAYLVNTEDKIAIKTIKVVNNEMEVYNEIVKSF